MTDDERIAYLAGDAEPAALTDAERAELDELRAQLADEALWVEPDPGLEDRIVAAVSGAAHASPPAPTAGTGGHPRRRWIRYSILGVAAAALLTAGLAIGLGGNDHPAEQYTAALQGTTLDPSASGRATLTETASGWRIQLHSANLPRRDDGEFYEAWLKSRAGVLVPIGTFNDGKDVTLWAGVPPGEYPILTVTRERADNAQGSSHQVVVSGATHPKP